MTEANKHRERLRLPRVVALFFAAAGVASQPEVWSAVAEIEGLSRLEPGASEQVSFRSTMRNDRAQTAWTIWLDVEEIQSIGGKPLPDGLTVSIVGRDAASRSECKELVQVDGNGVVGSSCRIESVCEGSSSGCSSDVEFELSTAREAEVAISWSAVAIVQATIGCAHNPDNVDADVTLELSN